MKLQFPTPQQYWDRMVPKRFGHFKGPAAQRAAWVLAAVTYVKALQPNFIGPKDEAFLAASRLFKISKNDLRDALETIALCDRSQWFALLALHELAAKIEENSKEKLGNRT